MKRRDFLKSLVKGSAVAASVPVGLSVLDVGDIKEVSNFEDPKRFGKNMVFGTSQAINGNEYFQQMWFLNEKGKVQHCEYPLTPEECFFAPSMKS